MGGVRRYDGGMRPRFLIDAHVHLNNHHEAARRPTEENVRDLFAKMDEGGIDHAVVIISYKVDLDRPSVEELLGVLADSPRTTLVEGLRWRSDDLTDLFTMEERISSGFVRGIKLYPGYDHYPIDDPSLESVFRVAAMHRVPVLIHTGDTSAPTAKVRMAHPLLVDDVAVDHPDVELVMCHLGNPWFQALRGKRRTRRRGRPTRSRPRTRRRRCPRSGSCRWRCGR